MDVGKDVRRLRNPADLLVYRITWRMSGCNKPGGPSSEAHVGLIFLCAGRLADGFT